jgi:ATP-dependent RNA helicase HelY
MATSTDAARPHLEAFAKGFDFPFDDFQVQACQAVAAGAGVLVAAPTGAGKTIVGEFAVFLALATGRKAFYTTPIKALSNQKYADLVRRHGADQVGLLTGDSSINGEAPVVVMTTEVLRNMMYAGSSTLRGLGFVVMDEVHYLADRFRGAVWEEVIIHLPDDVQLVSLSATVSNAEEFGAWLSEVRGDTTVIVEEHRPVPLWQHMMVGQGLYDLFAEETSAATGVFDPTRVNPELLERIRDGDGGDHASAHDGFGRARGVGADGRGRRGTAVRGGDRGRRGNGGGQDGGGLDRRGGAGPARRGGRFGGGPSRYEVIERLDRDGLLPAITFIFSRVGCTSAVSQLLAADMRLIPQAEGDRIRRTVEERIQGLADEDLGVLGYWEFVEGLTRGFAAHHAGLLPTFREIVEELFTAGRIRAVFATETLALGINMPARSVVLERLVKFNGETHADITPAEYTQLTGRAGRRGIDIEGHAVVLYNRGLDPLALGGLASTRTYPLRSSFRPTYNMAVNLVGQVGREAAREILETSFAQFQADRAVVGMALTVKRNEEALAGYAESMTCHLGDFTSYAALRNEIRDIEKEAAKARSASRLAEAAISLERLRLGDVIKIAGGRRSDYAIVVQANAGGKKEGASPTVLTSDAQVRRLTPMDVSTPLAPVINLSVPKRFNARNAKSRKDLAATMRIKVPHDPPTVRHTGSGGSLDEERVSALRRRMRAHPCHACPERENHARWAERWWRLRRETDGVARTVEGRANTVARTFDRICELLVDLGYLTEGGAGVTPQGDHLKRLYTEKDLLAAECLRLGIWKRLDPPSLAAIVSTLVHEPRRDDGEVSPRMPNDDVREAYDAMVRRWGQLEDSERAHTLPSTVCPDAGMAWMMHRWAGGQRLEVVLRDSEMAAGDFVRGCKQVIDLLGQIGDAAADRTLSVTARRAIDAVMRGVVAADRLD